MTETTPSAQIDAIIARTPDWRGATLARLRAVITAAGPHIEEQVKWKKPSRPEGVPVWFHEGNLAIADTLKRAVRLTFPAGAALPDPHHLFNARLDSKGVRAIDFGEGDAIDAPALQALIAAAARHNEAKTTAR